jgi:alkylhydroperoxidase family enzyme
MYLKAIEEHVPTEAAGRYGRAIQAARQSGAPIPQIFHLFAFQPRAATHLNAFMQEIMRGASPLSSGWRELIAAWTSARNRCRF